jgi:hypothetical protein
MSPTDAIPTGSADRSRSRKAGALALLSLLPAIAFLGPGSRFDPVLLVALSAIAVVSYCSTVWLRPVVFLDGEFVAVLLATAFLGPVPGLCVWLCSEAVYFLVDRHRPAAHAANVASYAWAVLAGATVLRLLGADHLTSDSGPAEFLALGAAAIPMLCVNFAITRGLVALVMDRRPAAATIRQELLRPAPATLLMIAVGVVTAWLYTRIGILAFGLFTLIVLVPQALLPVLLKPQPVSQLDRSQVVSLYLLALARELRLGRAEQLVLLDAATFLAEPAVAGQLSSACVSHALEVRETVMYHREHWDGADGSPGSVGGDMIPLTSRILAVAAAWAGLTGSRSPGLTHSQALVQLESRAGMHFDPRVVAAAVNIVSDEKLGRSADTAHQPRLHQVGFPRLVARLAALAGQTA